MKTVDCTLLQEIPQRMKQLQVDLLRSQRKLIKEKQQYFNLWSKHKELQTLHSADSGKPLTETPQQDDAGSLDKKKELDRSQLLDEETMTELMKLHVIMEDVTFALEKVQVIKKYWSDKVCVYSCNNVYAI